MTEEEAKQKWCPMASRSPNVIYAADRNEFPELCCIGSACMMWRWDYYPNPNYNPHMATTEPAIFKSTNDGHCGLAGKP